MKRIHQLQILHILSQGLRNDIHFLHESHFTRTKAGVSNIKSRGQNQHGEDSNPARCLTLENVKKDCMYVLQYFQLTKTSLMATK